MSAYPIRPAPDDDPRFTGLAADVAAVLESHGYPAFEAGADHVRLRFALFRLLYGDAHYDRAPPPLEDLP